jgi:hypothetical protein
VLKSPGLQAAAVDSLVEALDAAAEQFRAALASEVLTWLPPWDSAHPRSAKSVLAFKERGFEQAAIELAWLLSYDAVGFAVDPPSGSLRGLKPDPLMRLRIKVKWSIADIILALVEGLEKAVAEQRFAGPYTHPKLAALMEGFTSHRYCPPSPAALAAVGLDPGAERRVGSLCQLLEDWASLFSGEDARVPVSLEALRSYPEKMGIRQSPGIVHGEELLVASRVYVLQEAGVLHLKVFDSRSLKWFVGFPVLEGWTSEGGFEVGDISIFGEDTLWRGYAWEKVKGHLEGWENILDRELDHT